MLCERCKIREANIQYTELVNGLRTEHNLCSQCARELDFGPYSAIFESDMPLGRLLSGILGLEDTSQKKERMKNVICPTCQLSYEEFIKSSCFGCQDCYGVFDLLIGDNIRQLQGHDTHRGKRPKILAIHEAKAEAQKSQLTSTETQEQPATSEEQIGLLEMRLRQALRQEEYEKAALYRDKIKALKGGGTDE